MPILAISDSGFVFDPVSGRVFTVNATGLAVVNALKSGEQPDAVPGLIAGAFEGEGGEDIAADVEEFVAHLREEGLVS